MKSEIAPIAVFNDEDSGGDMSTHYQIGYFGPTAGEPVVNLPGGGQVFGKPKEWVIELPYARFTMMQGKEGCSTEQQNEAYSPQSAEPTQGVLSKEGAYYAVNSER